MKSQSAKRYPPELRERAVRMLLEHRNEYDSEPDAIRAISSKIGCYQIRHLTRMQLIRTLAAWRPDVTAYRNVQDAYRIALKSLARRYLELHDEIADLDVMITSIVDELAPELIRRKAVGYECAACTTEIGI